jgi:hypothetical protein
MSFDLVSPPDKVPVDELAKSYGLVDGLKCEVSRSSYRCAECSEMQRAESLEVWVPDGILLGDPAWSVSEKAREMAYNGNFSAWCMECAQKLGVNKKRKSIVLWERIRRMFE